MQKEEEEEQQQQKQVTEHQGIISRSGGPYTSDTTKTEFGQNKVEKSQQEKIHISNQPISFIPALNIISFLLSFSDQSPS